MSPKAAGRRLDELAEDLYGEPLERFTPARNERAAQLRADGERELADQVGSLRKPTVAAWVVNALARNLADELDQLLELGEQLREAQSDLDGDELRELNRQRRQVLTALTKQARSLGRELGQKVSDQVATQVEETLLAAMVDAQAAEAVRSGVLVTPLASTGFGSVDLEGALAVPSARRGTTRPKRSPQKTSRTRHADEQKRAETREALAAAERELEQASADREQASQAVADASEAARDSKKRVGQLRDELDDAERDARQARREEEEARNDLERLDRAQTRAERAVERARARVAKLDG